MPTPSRRSKFASWSIFRIKLALGLYGGRPLVPLTGAERRDLYREYCTRVIRNHEEYLRRAKAAGDAEWIAAVECGLDDFRARLKRLNAPDLFRQARAAA